jgi:hypothetical protein
MNPKNDSLKIAEPTPQRGLRLPCPKCGEEDAALMLWLSDGATFTCQECDGEFTADDVRRFMDRWAAALAWVDAMPTAQ